MLELAPVFVGRGQDFNQFMETTEILPRHRRVYRRLDQMVARYNRRVCASHLLLARCRISRILVEAAAPADGPAVKGGRVVEQGPRRRVRFRTCDHIA